MKEEHFILPKQPDVFGCDWENSRCLCGCGVDNWEECPGFSKKENDDEIR